MDLRFAALLLVPIAAAPAYSAPPLNPPRLVTSPPSEPRLDLKFRLIEDPVFAPGPVHNSGMIAQTPVAPNASIGFGILKVAPRKPVSGEFRQESAPTGSRKAAVRFTIKF